MEPAGMHRASHWSTPVGLSQKESGLGCCTFSIRLAIGSFPPNTTRWAKTVRSGFLKGRWMGVTTWLIVGPPTVAAIARSVPTSYRFRDWELILRAMQYTSEALLQSLCMIDQFLSQFHDHLRYERNVSEHTLRNYRSDLEQFYDYLAPGDPQTG